MDSKEFLFQVIISPWTIPNDESQRMINLLGMEIKSITAKHCSQQYFYGLFTVH